MRGDIVLTEAIEFERDGEPIMRISAIRESIEFMSWEVVGGAEGDCFYRSLNSSSKASFRFPFYAYLNGTKEVKIYNLDKPFLGVNYRRKGSEEETFDKIAFSNLGNLFIQATTETEIIYYRLNCVEDLTTDEIRKNEIVSKDEAQNLLNKMSQSTNKFG